MFLYLVIVFATPLYSNMRFGNKNVLIYNKLQFILLIKVELHLRCIGAQYSTIGSLNCSARDTHTVPLGGPDLPFRVLLYSAFGIPELHD